MSQDQNSQATKTAPEQKYVVLHQGVSGVGGGGFEQGAVVPESQLGADNIGRLIALGAIRTASVEESKLTKVTVEVKNDTRSRSIEQQLSEAEAANLRLVKEKSDLEERLGTAERLLAQLQGGTKSAAAPNSNQQGNQQGGHKGQNGNQSR